MNKNDAQIAILKILKRYKHIRRHDRQILNALKSGKLYELYVLSRALLEIKRRGFQVVFRGKDLKFKASPGLIAPLDPHFEIYSPNSWRLLYKMYTDIEFQTLGSVKGNGGDESCYHELDIMVVDHDAVNRPSHEQVALGIECKSTANFSKSIVREALGARRELSLLVEPTPSRLLVPGNKLLIEVPANPASEYWLAFVDPKGLKYKASPAAFGISLLHLAP